MASRIGKSSSYPLRLPITTRLEVEALAKKEGISINQLINLAVAEKIVRCQERVDQDQANGANAPTLPAPNRRQRLETRSHIFGV